MLSISDETHFLCCCFSVQQCVILSCLKLNVCPTHQGSVCAHTYECTHAHTFPALTGWWIFYMFIHLNSVAGVLFKCLCADCINPLRRSKDRTRTELALPLLYLTVHHLSSSVYLPLSVYHPCLDTSLSCLSSCAAAASLILDVPGHPHLQLQCEYRFMLPVSPCFHFVSPGFYLLTWTVSVSVWCFPSVVLVSVPGDLYSTFWITFWVWLFSPELWQSIERAWNKVTYPCTIPPDSQSESEMDAKVWPHGHSPVGEKANKGWTEG